MSVEVGEYQVIGTRAYRGHQPGTTFEALLNPNAERRALGRGDIVLIRRLRPDLEPGSYTYPDGWEPPPESVASTHTTEAAEAASFMHEGG